MKFDPRIHHRGSFRLPGYDYTRAGAFYLAISNYILNNPFNWGTVDDNQKR
jgi:hypothetical protein